MNHSDRTVAPEKQPAATGKNAGRRQTKRSFFEDPFMGIMHFVASLRLTVVLLILSVFVILVATLQQIEMDIWQVKQLHFPALTVYVPLYTFTPPAWMPTARTYLQELHVGFLGIDRPIGVIIPSGFAVILAMLVNLTAAHTLRFRIQTRGRSMLVGLLVSAIGILVCAGVVLIGQSNGLQNQPMVTYNIMWTVTLIAMFATGLAAAIYTYFLARYQMVERILLGSLAAILCVVPVLLAYTGASIGESGMRILWQIAQCSGASIVLLAGLVLLFRRKAGIVLLHAGLILLLGNEIWVTLTHLEQRLSGDEGQTIAHAIDIRQTELVLVNRQGEKDRVYSIPVDLLARSARSGDSPEAWIPVPNTDLEVRCLQYFPNSDVTMPQGQNLATQGLGTQIVAKEVPPVGGVSASDQMDTASAYVQFRNSSGDDLGTFLASQFQRSPAPIFSTPNIVSDGDQKYALRLWYKRFFKPYEITIESVESMDYPGTEIPRWYSTEFHIVDHETGYEGTQKVWMNNPLRYGNETFYQSGYFRDPETGVESTTLQVVRNRGWMIPYLCCAMVSIGLLAQFIPVMLGYIEKRQRTGSVNVNELDGTVEKAPFLAEVSRPSWVIPVIAASLVGLLFIGWAYPKKPKHQDLNLTSLAKMPISYKGRIQPLDSLARTNLRKTIGLETAKSHEMTIFGEKKYPAIAWLADSIFLGDTNGKYRIFRVVNPTLLQNMHLSARSGFRYTGDELNESLDTLRRLDDAARKKDKGERNELEKAALDLGRKLAETQTIVNALGGPSSFVSNRTEERPVYLYEKIVSAAATKSAIEVPGVVPGTEPMAPWMTLDEALARQQLEKIADQTGTKEAIDLFVEVINYSMAEAMMQQPTIRDGLADLLDGKSEDEQLATLAQRVRLIPPEKLPEMIRSLLQFPDPRQFMQVVFSATQKLVGEGEIVKLTETQNRAADAWIEVKDAYVAQDQTALDKAVSNYDQTLREAAEVTIPWGKVSTEYQLSGWSPFYVASVMCLLVSLVSVPAMLGMPRLRSFAFLLQLLAFGLITFGMIARIYISGRAPVTSIYSSALAIAWGCVLGFLILEAVTKRGIANVLGGFAGYAILLTAYGLSLNDDKFSVLRAVLDTQFWLWTHVTCVALGYVLTILAGLWSCVILVMAIWSNRNDVKQAAELTYGLICAATILSFVGTVLGGLWADDSWGRFWGWDPKENGAAMIVLWNAAVLHARWAGMIRYRGLMVMALFGNVITLWSWFAVNELGIGLHSYGFTEGVIFYLSLAWAFHFVAIAAAFLPVRNMAAKIS